MRSFLVVLIFTVASVVTAFVPQVYKKSNGASFGRIRQLDNGSSCTRRPMLPDITSNIIIATIDADIANIPTNEFAPIFAGGIAVMFGGLFSALMVGFIIDKRNLYVNIVADSYAQGADDEAFWKGLSEEEKKKTQELLQRLKESKEGGSRSSLESTSASETSPTQSNAIESNANVQKSIEIKETREVGIFSDYGDE